MPTIIENSAGEYFCFALATPDQPLTFAAPGAATWSYTAADGHAYTFDSAATLAWLAQHLASLRLTPAPTAPGVLAWVPVPRFLPQAERLG